MICIKTVPQQPSYGPKNNLIKPFCNKKLTGNIDAITGHYLKLQQTATLEYDRGLGDTNAISGHYM